MPIRIVLVLSLIALATDARAHDGPVSALQFENPPQLELVEILERWKTGFGGCDRPGRLTFYRVIQDEIFWTAKESQCEFFWDGNGNWQLVVNPFRVNSWGVVLVPRGSFRPHVDARYTRVADDAKMLGQSGNEFIVVDLARDSFEAWPALQRQNFVFNWLGFPHATLLIREMPRQLVGPGWPDTPGDWTDSWEWTVLSQNSTLVMLQAKPRNKAEKRLFSEIRWAIARQFWQTCGMRVFDRNRKTISTWYRTDGDIQRIEEYPGLSPERLEAAGFRNHSIPGKPRKLQSQRPADALVPRNRLVW